MTDSISRQAAIDAVKELCEHYTSTKSVKHPHMDYVIEELELLPPAYPKKGKWIKADRQQYFRKHYPASQCSICGWRKNYSGKYNYCPNCGADMRERNECVD